MFFFKFLLLSHKPIYLVVTLKDTDPKSELKGTCKNKANQIDQNNNSDKINNYLNLNNTIGPLGILPEYDQLPFNYILVNNYLFDLNKTSLHNYAKFKNFNQLNVPRAISVASEALSNTTTNQTAEISDENLLNLKKYFSLELNENLFQFKRYLLSLNLILNLNDSQYMFQNTGKLDWRDCMILNIQPQKTVPHENVHISELVIEDGDAVNDKACINNQLEGRCHESSTMNAE